MKKPSPHRFLLGTNLACLVSTSISGFVVYGWYCGELQVSWMLPAFCVGFTVGCLKARAEVRQFRAWERDWNAMAGVAAATPRFQLKKLPLVWAVWSGLLLLGITQPFASSADKQGFVLAFIASTIWAGAVLWRHLKRRMFPSHEVQSKDYIVEQCLPVPSRSPSINEIRSAVPAYCHAVLNRSPNSPR